MKIYFMFCVENMGAAMCATLSEIEWEKYLPSRVSFLMLGGKSDSLLDYDTHNSIFASL